MSLEHIRHKIFQFQGGVGADPIFIVFGAVAIVILFSSVVIFILHGPFFRGRRHQRRRRKPVQSPATRA